jgi:hypothetical protein
MATLSPELLAYLRSTVTPTNAGTYIDPVTRRAYSPTWEDVGGTGTGEGYSPNTQIAGWTVYDMPEGVRTKEDLNGLPYANYDTAGNQTKDGIFTGLKTSGISKLINSGLPVLSLAAPFALSMFPALGAAASFGTNPVLSGASMTGATQAAGAGGAALAGGAAGAGGSAAGGSGAFLGEGVASGVPAWDAAGTNAGLSLSGGETANLIDKAVNTATGASKWLGPAATLLGGLTGAQGQKTEETSQRRTDPRVDPYLFGANGQPGLLQMTYDKLVGQMAPGGLQGYDDMQRVGMGLLNAPVAGNGFGLFGRGR